MYQRSFVLRRNLWALLVILCALCGGYAAVAAAGNVTSVWLNNGSPTIQKSVELAPNVLPQTSYTDCTPISVKRFQTTTYRDDCVVTTAFGQAGSSGVIFAGTNEQIPIEAPFPFYGLDPIPNQDMMTTYSTAPVIGSYLHFYRSVRSNLPSFPQCNGAICKYVLKDNPDFSLRDADGKLLVVNTAAMAYSPSGNWLVADILSKGLVRINMATFEMVAFGRSLQPNDYSSQPAQIAISNDGATVLVKPLNYTNFKVYDLAHCSGPTSLPVNSGAVPCPVRDYFDDLTNQISGFRSLYNPRLLNDAQIAFTAVYDYAPGNYKVATFTLTAPGVSATGIQYLGMGDSFASGEGAFNYVSGTDTANNRCHLSSRSYAYLLSGSLFSSGHAVSCSGAFTKDIANISNSYKGQVKDGIEKSSRSTLSVTDITQNYTPGFLAQSEFVDTYKPEVITVSIGGNDIGFQSIVTRCVSPFARPKACYPTYEDRLELFNTVSSKFTDIANAYKSVLKPGKRVYAIGYPKIVAANGNCAVNVFLEPSEIDFANDLIDHLNATVQRAADKAGVRYVDVSEAFAGHKLCETNTAQIAVNGMTAGGDVGLGPVKVVGSESYHPNTLGHELLAQAIRTKTSNLTQPMPVANPALNTTGLPSSLNNRSLPKTGRSTNVVVPSPTLAPDSLIRNQNFSLEYNDGLKPNSVYRISLNGNQIGVVTSDTNAKVTISLAVPATAETGFQALDIFGPNLLNQSLDVTKTVYVAPSQTDYNDDGTPDTFGTCAFMALSGLDTDKDGIDDACDGYIDNPPPPKLTKLTGQAYLLQNSLSITARKP